MMVLVQEPNCVGGKGQAYLFAFGSLRHAFGAAFRPPILLGH